MNRIEINRKLAEAYGINEKRIELVSIYSHQGWTTEDKIIPLHQDTLTLFRLCIEHGIDLMFYSNSVEVAYKDVTDYSDYPTKELATCAAMFMALCKLKGIENE